MNQSVTNKYQHWESVKQKLATSTNTYEVLLAAAGCGKSKMIMELIKEDPKYACLTATTGISAVNIGATTIHSKLGYRDVFSLLHEVNNGQVFKKLSWIAEDGYRRIIIDELSMMSGEELDLICVALERYNKSRLADEHGPLSLLLVGDVGQLPAVKGRAFFQSKIWNKFNVNYLYEVMRQDEVDYINSLLSIRLGDARSVADWFEENIGFQSSIDEDFEGATLFSTNAEADKYNRLRLSKLKGVEKGYKKFVNGKARSEWSSIPDELKLKVGSKVILLRNNHAEGYANGDMGIVKDMFMDKIIVEMLRRKGKEVMIEYVKVENKAHRNSPVLGSMQFLPVRGADSITIFKSQSLSMEAAQVNLREPFLSRISGGLYVALSRVRSKNGLRLVGSKTDFIKGCYLNPLYYQMVLSSTRYIA